MIETGTVLQQRYKIDKQIGQGGMGAVYVATDERFGSTVAIKETLCLDDNFRKAIEREARLLNSLKHTALPRVSDHFEESNGLFLVMEYIPGDDVAAMIESDHASFSVERIMIWADQLLDALDYLHNQEIPVIHRDIKPQNLKINSRGEMILLDFGLAKGNPTDASHQTAAKSIFGYSRNYASLEQIQGTGTDPRSDLYSLAATLYHLLTKVAPEDALTRAMSVLSQNGDPLAAASSVNPAVPRGVAGVLRKALDLNAGERPASAAEMRQMLSESEKYAHLADVVTIRGLAAEPAVFAQQTKLMPDQLHTGTVKRTDAKTEILPGNLSHATAVRGAGFVDQTNLTPVHPTSSPANKGRGLGVAAAALLLLLVGGVIAGGFYFVNPSIFGGKKDNEKTADPSTMVPVVVEANTEANSTSTGLEAAAGEANSAQIVTETVRPNSADKPVETTKNSKATGSTKAKTDPDLGEVTDIQVDDPDISRGGVIITDRDENGKVTTMRVNPIGPPNARRPPPNGMNPLPLGIDPRNLTPEQRRKLQRMLRNNPEMQRPIPLRP